MVPSSHAEHKLRVCRTWDVEGKELIGHGCVVGIMS